MEKFKKTASSTSDLQEKTKKFEEFKGVEDEDEDDDDETLHGSFSELDLSDVANDAFTALSVRDAVQESLEKPANQRTELEINVLKDFLQHFSIFTNFQKETQETICKHLNYLVVEKENSIILREGDPLNYWAVLIDGCLEVSMTTAMEPGGLSSEGQFHKTLHIGDCFGLDPFNDKELEEERKSLFQIKSRVPSCHFLSVSKRDWNFIKNKGGKSVEKETIKNGKKVLVVEERPLGKSPQNKGYIVKKGTKDQLIEYLIDENSSRDPNFVEDFLLTSRAFLSRGMTSLVRHLITWVQMGDKKRDKSVKIMLLWVNNHFHDFEANPGLALFLTNYTHYMHLYVSWLIG